MVNREKQASVLRRTQAIRKDIKKEQVLKAIQEIKKHSQPLTFKNIATLAGCSVSYLYKWDDIKTYIHELQKEIETTLNQIEEPEVKYQPHSLKTLHQVASYKIRQLEGEIRELKRQNEILRGHVAEIYEIKDENERLRTQLRELTISNNKVIPIQTSKIVSIKGEHKITNNDTPLEVIDYLQAMGIKVTKKLREEIKLRDIEKVKLSIEAYKQYRDSYEVKSPAACLLSMICDQAEPNIENKPDKPQPSIFTVPLPKEKLVPLDKLKQLSSLFNQDND
ncbi:MAG: transposase [Richelia sp. SM1_7_0]|nr:transposase [Richelia sp. SM1_7_0]